MNLESLLAGEYAENEFRKEFTASERAAIGAAVEKEIGKQQGKQLVQNISQVEHVKSRDLIAQRAGFGNPTTMGQAQRVVERGAQETIRAMDSGDLSISAAATIASQPKEKQREIVRMPKDKQREVVRHIRKTKADKEADERRANHLRVFRGFS